MLNMWDLIVTENESDLGENLALTVHCFTGSARTHTPPTPTTLELNIALLSGCWQTKAGIDGDEKVKEQTN